MSGRNITLLKKESAGTLRRLIGFGGKGLKKYMHTAGAAGRTLARGVGADEAIGTVAGYGTALAAPVIAARYTGPGRKVERAVGKTMGTVGRLGERTLTPSDWGRRPGETF